MPHKFGDHAPWSRLMHEERQRMLPAAGVLELLAAAPGSTVVEVGAGIGYITLPLALAVGPAGTVIATDVADEALAHLKARVEAEGLGHVRLVKNEESRLPLDSGVADRALLVDVFHELEDPAALLADVHRVLRPGGSILVVDWDPGWTDAGPPHHERLTRAAAQELLEAAGFGGEPLAFAHPSHWALRGTRPRQR